MATDSSRYLADLHQTINERFNLEDVRGLCFDLGIDFDNMGGEGKSARIRELILLLARRDELQSLVVLARRERPTGGWIDVPPDFSLPDGLGTPETGPPANPGHYGPVVFNQQNQNVGGDSITIGDISGSQGIAIGAGARAEVHHNSAAEQPPNAADLTALFAPLQVAANTQSPEIAYKVGALQAEVARGAAADDNTVAGLIQDLVNTLPAVSDLLRTVMANPAVAPAANGSVTKWVLNRL